MSYYQFSDQTRRELSERVKSIWHNADSVGRELHRQEAAEVEAILQELEKRKAASMHTRASLNGEGSWEHGGRLGGAPGDMFIKSDGWAKIAEPTSRPQQWSVGPIDVTFSGKLGGGYSAKAGTLFESGQGAGVVPQPQMIPGIVSTLFQPLSVSDVFPVSPTTTPTVRYIVEGTATNAAAGVAEGGTKPPSDIALSTVDEPVKKIATVLTVSDELFDDAPTVQSYLNDRLGLFVSLEQERQLLRGTGTNELVGVFGRSGINQYTKLAADDNTTALAKVLANTRGSSQLQPDAIIMHPTNWLNSRLLRDGTGGTVGQYFGGGPFGGAYGNVGAPGLFGESMWNTRVVLSTNVGLGTALVGSFGQAAKVHTRGGPTLEATNSHASYFTNNLIMLRAEARLALCIYRPSAFTEVRGLV